MLSTQCGRCWCCCCLFISFFLSALYTFHFKWSFTHTYRHTHTWILHIFLPFNLRFVICRLFVTRQWISFIFSVCLFSPFLLMWCGCSILGYGKTWKKFLEIHSPYVMLWFVCMACLLNCLGSIAPKSKNKSRCDKMSIDFDIRFPVSNAWMPDILEL